MLNPGVSVCQCVCGAGLPMWKLAIALSALTPALARARVSVCQSAVYSSQILQVMPLVFRVKLS